MTKLGYFGADIVLDKEKGPFMLEMNARPGLAIQIANQEGLKKRLNFIDKYCPKNMSDTERLNFILK
jgi:D-alanine-D-alanine ligase-like ATP-grasp enzyme